MFSRTEAHHYDKEIEPKLHIQITTTMHNNSHYGQYHALPNDPMLNIWLDVNTTAR